VIFRLPRQRPPLDERLWPELCPEDQKEEKIHVELPNCPPNLPPIFAAQIHSEGRCCYAWLKGVVVMTKGERKGDMIRIRADLVENPLENGGDYLLLAVRTTADTFGKEISIFNKMFAFMKEEREERLPGLHYSFVKPCPYCKKENIEWSSKHGEDEEYFCEVCYKNVPIGENLNSSAFSGAVSSTETASRTMEQIQNQLVPPVNPNAVKPADKAPMREYGIIFISARFDGGPREQEARDLKDELVKIGLDARMVEAAVGKSFGDDTNDYLYSMKTMIAFCFDNYGQKTVSRYSTYHELNLANDKDKHIFPIRRCAEWPPKPPLDHDGGKKGIVQNYNVFTGGLAYLDWSNKKWNPAACAKKVKKELQKIRSRSDLVRSRSTTRRTPRKDRAKERILAEVQDRQDRIRSRSRR
jgi:hypothetical protein